MESKTCSSDNAAAEPRTKDLACWQTTSNAQCLRVETEYEIHLFPYGYFQHATFSRDGNKDVLRIQFQDQIVVAKGKGLESLCTALERLAVERIRTQPDKYQVLAKDSGMIEEIEIKHFKDDDDAE